MDRKDAYRVILKDLSIDQIEYYRYEMTGPYDGRKSAVDHVMFFLSIDAHNPDSQAVKEFTEVADEVMALKKMKAIADGK